MNRILVLEDDKDLNRVVCRHLNAHQFYAVGCLNAREAYDKMYSEHFDLIISDIMMQEIDGYEFAENIRRQDQNIPILFMTAREDFGSKERSYRLGVDDYMVKPIDLNELLLRIRALLRRANIASEKKLVIGGTVLDEEAVTATVNGESVGLTLREFQIVFKMLSYPGKAFTRTQLIEEFSGYESETGLRSVDVSITNLRAKFARCTDFKIVTVRGLGYKAVIL